VARIQLGYAQINVPGQLFQKISIEVAGNYFQGHGNRDREPARAVGPDQRLPRLLR
jgi:hypothetical protein